MNKTMRQVQSGFTLIELVMVIVILGILAAVAIPRYVNLSTDAYKASASGYAGALSGANSINYAGCAAKGSVVTTNVCSTVAKCSDLKSLLQPALTITTGALPTPTVAGTLYIVTDTTVATGVSATCTLVVGDGTNTGQTATFTVTGAP